MDKDEYILVIASLLHDIGKIRQRYSQGENHAEHGYKMIREFSNFPYIQRIAKLVRYHHTEEKYINDLDESDLQLLRILKRADYLSASHDREDKDPDTPTSHEKKLEKIFKLLNEEPDRGNEENKFFPLTTLDEFLRSPMDPNIKGYQGIEKSFIKDITEIKFNEDYKRIIDDVVSILEKNLIFVPSAYYYSKGDISLYHHSVLTAAIALSLYRQDKYNTSKLMLIGGNLSGIQNYIFKYYISEVADSKATKRLKGRSLIVSLYTDSIISFILEKLDLTWSHVVYRKSDGFMILANEIDEETFNSMRNDIERGIMLLGRDITASIGRVTFPPEVLDPARGEDFGEKINSLFEAISIRKYKLSSEEPDEILAYIKRDDTQGHHICDYCGLSFTDESDEGGYKCLMCRREETFSSWVSRDKNTIYQIILKDYNNEDQNIRNDRNTLIFNYGVLKVVYSLNYMDNSKALFINPGENDRTPKGSFRIMLLGKYVPLSNDGTIASINDKLCCSNSYINQGSINNLIRKNNKECIGDRDYRKCRNLGILKLDMDNMGTILSSRMKRKGGNTERKSLSIMASFSYFTNLFFASVVNELAKEMDQNNKDSDEGESFVYVIYSGGDDLVAFGRDIDMIRFAKELHDKFVHYFYSENITISAGLGIFEAKFPVRRGVELTERELDKSKSFKEGNHEKNSITVAGVTMKWPEYSKMMERAIDLFKNMKDKEIGKNFPYYLLQISRINLEEAVYLKRNQTIYVPDEMIYYYFKRNLKGGWNKEDREKMIEDLAKKFAEGDVIKDMKFIVLYSVLKLRNLEEYELEKE